MNGSLNHHAAPQTQFLELVETDWQDISHKIEDFVSIGHIVFEARVVIAIDAEAK